MTSQGDSNAPLDAELSPAEAKALLGFRDGINGPHAARTMMLEDVATLFGRVPRQASKEEYAAEIIGANCLAKPTRKARELAFRYLAALFGLDPQLPVFRVFRDMWDVDERGRPVLALCAALARDPLLRSTQSFIMSKHVGEPLDREATEHFLADTYVDRFTAASLRSFAQNINGSWTQAGFLTGRIRKVRSAPVVTYTNVAFCLFLGHLEGLTGQRLFTSSWIDLLGRGSDEAAEFASAASQRGLLLFMNAGGVREIRFPGYLTEQEEAWRLEVSHV